MLDNTISLADLQEIYRRLEEHEEERRAGYIRNMRLLRARIGAAKAGRPWPCRSRGTQGEKVGQ
mgnify:CR=1 FL=1